MSRPIERHAKFRKDRAPELTVAGLWNEHIEMRPILVIGIAEGVHCVDRLDDKGRVRVAICPRNLVACLRNVSAAVAVKFPRRLRCHLLSLTTGFHRRRTSKSQ